MQNILKQIYNDIEKQRRRKYNWSEYLELLKREPQNVLRNIYQYMSDFLNHYVGQGIDEYPEDPENINYVYYDMSSLFEKSYEPFFADRLFANRFMNIFNNIHKSRQNKIYIIKGPHGSGKSTFLNNLLSSLEEYSKSEDSKLFSIIWILDKEKLIGEDYEGQRYLEVPCPSNDNPLFLIPSNQRYNFLKEFLTDSKEKEKILHDKEYEWIYYKEPCAICSSIFQSILDKLGSSEDVFNMVYAKKYVFNKKIGSGLTVYYPSDEIPRTKVKTNKIIQDELDKIFEDKKVEYKFSEFAKVNNGIYSLMDTRDNNVYRFDYLHGLVSEGVHKIDDIEERTDSLFITISNKDEETNENSFKDRIQQIDLGYILDVNTQVKVYKNKFGKEIEKFFLPEVIENFSRAIISTRLREHNPIKYNWINDPDKYKQFCDSDLQLLKIEMYGGNIPQWLREEDKKNFTMEVRKHLINEAAKEGKDGLSERDSINIFWDLLNKYAKKDDFIGIKTIIKYFENADLKIEEEILKGIENMYGYTVLQQIKEALYYYNVEKITNDILNYLCALNYEFGEIVYCRATGDNFKVDEDFLIRIEKGIIKENLTFSEVREFRERQLKKYISDTLQKEYSICETDQFKDLYGRYIYNLKSKALEPFLNNETFRQAIKDYSNNQFHSYDDNIKKNVEFLMNNLQEKFEYSIKGAQEACIYVIDNGIAEKFTDQIKPGGKLAD